MSTPIGEKRRPTRPAEPDDRQRARQSKHHPDCRSTTIKLTAHANIACVIVGPRQSSSRRDRRNGHPDCRCVPIQIVALHAVRLLGRVHLPRAVGALLTVLLVIGALVGLVAALSVPAATWAERLPEGIPRLEAHLEGIKGPIQALQKVIQKAEQVATAPPSRASIVSVRRDLGLAGALFAGTRSVLDGLFTTVLVLYFLLVAGNIFLRRIVEILPTFSNKRQAVDISQQIQEG